VLLEMCLNSVHQRVALWFGESAGHEFHDLSIGIESSKGLPIRVVPTAKH
jgi:hypothetical protein